MAEMSPEKRALLDLFGERVKAIRQDRMKVTQQELADLMHAPRTWVSDLENGGQRGLAFETVVRFAKALAVSADYLLGLTDDPTPATRRRRPRPPAQIAPVPTSDVAPARLIFGLWKDKMPPDFDAHFDDLDEELIRLFEGEDDADVSAR